MGKKKGKAKDDDWEEEAFAIVEAETQVVAKEIKEGKIDLLFADAIARGKATDGDYDRATDELASGMKTEDEIIAFYFPNAAREDADDDDDAKGGRKVRGWRADRDGRHDALPGAEDDGDAATAEAAAAEAAVRLHAELFGEAGAPNALDVAADGLGVRERVALSERHLDEWRRAAGEAPKEMPLPNMTGVCLFGNYGVSTHAGALVRLWDAATGRRLAAHQQKLELTALAAAGAVVAVGDAAGGLHLYSTEADFVPVRHGSKGVAHGQAVRSIALLPLGGATADLLALASSDAGVVTATLARPGGGGSQLPRPVLPLRELGGGRWPIHLATGSGTTVFAAAGPAVALHDLASGACAWTAEAPGTADRLGERAWPGGGALLEPAWQGAYVADLVDLADAVGALGLEPPPAAADAAGGPARPLWYSPAWRLLASAVDGGGVVALWDVRVSGERGPAAAIRAPGGAAWLHIDEAGRMGGQLLIAAPSGGSVQVYDIRRVPCARTSSAVRPMMSFAPPPSAATACFAAHASTLVVGGGAKCGSAWRYCGATADGDAAEGEEEEEERARKPAKEKKKRLAKKEMVGSRQSRMA